VNKIFIRNIKKKVLDLLPKNVRYFIHNNLTELKVIKKRPVTRFSGEKDQLLFFPDYSFGNPYQILLYKHLNIVFNLDISGFEYYKFTRKVISKYKTGAGYIHIHWLHPFFDLGDERAFKGFLNRIAFARSNGFRIIWTVHNLVSHESVDRLAEIEINKRFAKLCDYILVHDRQTAAAVEELYEVPKERIIVCPHGTYRGYYPDTVKSVEARKKLGIREDEFVFLFLGLIRKYKGLENLLEIFGRLSEKYRNIRLIIAGRVFEDELADKIREEVLLNRQLSFVPRFIPDEEIQNFFAASQITVLPFSKISTSGSAILSLSFGKPVIVPNEGGMHELVTKETGFIFKDLQELETIMEKVIVRWQNGDKQIGFTASAFDELNKGLSWDTLVRNHLSVIFQEPDVQNNQNHISN
jgi:glycosyltransferase involved in cell wall biosynthesis